ncbi:hypothetical protein CCP3SC15_380012 [Gammaproteobacteria bacterium]
MENHQINLGFDQWKKDVAETFTNEPLSTIEAANVGFRAGIEYCEKQLLLWAKERFEMSGMHRPENNIHYRTLYDTWMLIINKFKTAPAKAEQATTDNKPEAGESVNGK